MTIFANCNSMLICNICGICKFPETFHIVKLTLNHSNTIFDIRCIRKLQRVFYSCILKGFFSTVNWDSVRKYILLCITYPTCFRKKLWVSISNTGKVNLVNDLCFSINCYLDRNHTFFRMFLKIYSSIDIERTVCIWMLFGIISVG